MGILHLFPSVFASKINIAPSLYLCFFSSFLFYLSSALAFKLLRVNWMEVTGAQTPSRHPSLSPSLATTQLPSTLTLQPSVSPSPKSLSYEPPGATSFTFPYSLKSLSQVKPR